MIKIITLLFATLIVASGGMQSFAISPGAGQAQVRDNMKEMQQNRQRMEQMQKNQQVQPMIQQQKPTKTITPQKMYK